MEKEYTGHYKDIYLRDPQGNVMAVYRIRKDSLYLYEIPLYGISRLGVIKENKLLKVKTAQNNTGFMSLPIPVNIALSKNALKQSIYPLGKKHYETTDWLGNVRVTYTDKKSWQQNKFALNVSSSQDYYPFGSVMEGRDLEITNYRFGFQGQEGDDEVYGKNNLWAYKYRLHDARLGRFFSVDPLADKYPYNSVYAFSENRVIDGVELEGLEYVSAANWANSNLIGWHFGTRGWYYSFSNYRKKNIIEKLNNEIYCYESVLLSMAQGNKIVAEYLQRNNIPLSRVDAVNWFKKGGKYHKFIKPTEAYKVKKGDILFKGGFAAWAGHAAIVNSDPIFSNDGKEFTLEVLSTNVGEDNIFGVKKYTFIQSEDGEWVEKASGQLLIGFGRIDEKGIMKEYQESNKDNDNLESQSQENNVRENENNPEE
ncbi:MAG: hypothetical protein KatS3mg027_2660 [Bacteroidia bacterium]|nr:MAG: hypothetical protein KatS3mg027_2660 [Bacteroidia bacterium]